MRTQSQDPNLARVAAIVLLFFTLGGTALGDQMHVVRIELRTPEAIFFVERYNLQRVSEFEGEIGDYLVDSGQLQALDRFGIEYQYLTEFIEPPTVTHLDPEYHTYEEVVQTLHQYQIDYPDLVRLDSLGSSFEEGRTVWCLKISDNVDLREDEPRILVDGNHHACELMGTEICMRMIADLLEGYGVDSTITFWIDNMEMFFVPIVNPDGHLVVENGISYYWRKNTRDTNGNGILYEYECNHWWTCFTDGVNLNRNYEHNWEYGNPNPWHYNYRGEYPYSEGEIEAMRNLAEQEHFLLAFTYHSYGEVVLYPWSEWPYTPDDDIYTQLSSELASQIVTYSGTGTYDYWRTNCERGMAANYHYAINRTYCFTVETLPYPLFIIPGDSIEMVYEANKPGILWAFEEICHGPGITVHAVDSISGEAVVAEITIQGRPEQTGVNYRTTEPRYGRFDIILPEGDYTLLFGAHGYESKTVPGVQVASSGWTLLEVELSPTQQYVEGGPLPGSMTCHRVCPNPFNNATTLTFELQGAGLVAVEIFNLKGQKIAEAFKRRLSSGKHDLKIALPDEASGVYLYRLNVNGCSWVGKMVLLK